MKILPTWAAKSEFKYEGSVADGTTIYYGTTGSKSYISSEQYSQLLNHFRSRSANIGTSRTNPPNGSVGEWLQKNVKKTAIEEDIDEREAENKIRDKLGRYTRSIIR